MKDRTCETCGKPSGIRKNCNRCAWRNKPRVPCSVCGGATGWSLSARVDPQKVRCRDCQRSASFDHGTPSGYSTHRYRKEDPCDACRLAWNEESRSIQQRARGRGYEPPGRTYRRLTCDECGTSVRSWKAGTAKDGITLCRTHRDAWQDLSRHQDAYRRAAKRKLAKAAKGRAANGRWPFIQGMCRHCEESFTRRGQPSAYCSKKCRVKDRPSRSWISQVDRLSIYERDNWTCQLCFESVEPESHYLSDWYPSLDHIECQSWALIPDHSAKNLRTCHRWCNSVRGNEEFYDEAVFHVAA